MSAVNPGKIVLGRNSNITIDGVRYRIRAAWNIRVGTDPIEIATQAGRILVPSHKLAELNVEVVASAADHTVLAGKAAAAGGGSYDFEAVTVVMIALDGTGSTYSGNAAVVDTVARGAAEEGEVVLECRVMFDNNGASVANNS